MNMNQMPKEMDDYRKEAINELIYCVERSLFNIKNIKEIRLSMNPETYLKILAIYKDTFVLQGWRGNYLEPLLFGERVLIDTSLKNGCVMILENQFEYTPIHPEWW